MNLSKPLVEAIKEFTRTLILGVVPILGGILLFIKSGINTDTGSFDIKWVVALAMFVSGIIGVVQTALMSALDKWLHNNNASPLDLKSFDSLKE